MRKSTAFAVHFLFCIFMLGGVGAVVFPASVANAQQGQKPSSLDIIMMFYYRDPQPQRLTHFVEQLDAAYREKWDAYPPAAGFLAVVFQKHPSQIEQLIPAKLSPKSATTITAALRMSGNQAIATKLKAKLDEPGADDKLKNEFRDLPVRLEDLRIGSPTHLDILWGASFASGDARYVRKIIEFFAQVANRSEKTAIDIARVVVAMVGGPRDIYDELRNRYGNDAQWIVVAATALWATESNARQHAFVAEAHSAYVKANPNSYATKAMLALRPKK